MILIQDNTELSNHLEDIYRLKRVGFDLETNGVDPHRDQILLCGIGDLEKQYLIDARSTNLEPLKEFLEDPSRKKIGSNLRFDYMFMKHLGIEPEGLIDCEMTERVLLCGLVHQKTPGVFSLEGMAFKYLEKRRDKTVRDTFQFHRGEFTKEQLEYLKEDIRDPILIWNLQKYRVSEHKLWATVNLENEVIPALGDIQYNGFYLDKVEWTKLIKENKQALKTQTEIAKDLFRDVCDTDLLGDVDIDLTSTNHVLYAFQKMGYNIERTMEEDLLTHIPKKLHEPFLLWRELHTAVSTFGEKWLDYIHPVTGRLHGNIWQIGAPTGRIAMTNPNLLQPPREEKYRSCFQSPEGKLITVDFSGQELRIITEICKQPEWIEAFVKDLDLHSIVGSKLFGKEVSKKKNKALRDIGKNLNFSTAYGGGPGKVMMFHRQVGIPCTFHEAKAKLRKFEQLYPLVVGVLNKIGENAISKGYTYSLGGRKRFFHITEAVKNPTTKEEVGKSEGIKREGKNNAIQSTGVDQLKQSMIIARKEIKKQKKENELKLVHCFHDELIAESLKNDEENQKLIEWSMLMGQEHYQYIIPAAVEGNLNKVWSK